MRNKLILAVILALAINQTVQSQTPGSVDTNYNPMLGTAKEVTALTCLPDVKTFVGGSFTDLNGTSIRSLVRLNQNGSLDTSFSPTNITEGAVSQIVVDHAGLVWVVGMLNGVNGNGRKGICRFTATGAVDPTFNCLGADLAYISSIGLQGYSKAIIVGNFSQINGRPAAHIARLNHDGSLDTSFTAQTDSYINTVLILPNGKILIGGAFSTVNGISRHFLAQLNSDGSLDEHFFFQPTDEVHALCPTPQGKILVGTSSSGPEPCVWELWDGAPRELVNADGPVRLIARQPNGAFVLSGDFEHVYGVPARGIALISDNGVVDTTFEIDYGPAGATKTIGIQLDGKILLGGLFSYVNGVPQNKLVRLDGHLPDLAAPQICTAVEVGWPSEAGSQYLVQYSTEVAQSVWTNLGQPVTATGTNCSVLDSTQNGARRFYRILKL